MISPNINPRIVAEIAMNKVIGNLVAISGIDEIINLMSITGPSIFYFLK